MASMNRAGVSGFRVPAGVIRSSQEVITRRMTPDQIATWRATGQRPPIEDIPIVATAIVRPVLWEFRDWETPPRRMAAVRDPHPDDVSLYLDMHPELNPLSPRRKGSVGRDTARP